MVKLIKQNQNIYGLSITALVNLGEGIQRKVNQQSQGNEFKRQNGYFYSHIYHSRLTVRTLM